jgi:DNA (cytosine-5)-methyltransferase 1
MSQNKTKRGLSVKKVSQENHSIENTPLKVLSLFSGGGGMDLGFEGGFAVLKESINKQLFSKFVERSVNGQLVELRKTRFTTVFANDIFEDAKNCWINYFTPKRGHSSKIFRSESIVDLVKRHKSGESVFPKDIDIVTGGFPCQDFSVAGKRNGFKSTKSHRGDIITDDEPSIETRGTLYMWMKEVIEITQPKMFIAENVKGLVNLGDVKNIIQHDFSTAGGNGYIVLQPQVLHAADYGVPQSRERVIFIGINKKYLDNETLKALSGTSIPESLNPYPKPTHAFTKEIPELEKPVSLDKVFKLVKEPELSKDLSQQMYSKAKFMGFHCQGQTEVKIKSISPTIRAEHHGNIEYRRHSKKRGGKNIKELEKGLKERRLSVRECALIQTFPMDYEFVIPNPAGKRGFLVSPSQAYKVIGNAVPPLLAYNIAVRLQEIWDVYFGKKANAGLHKPQTIKGGFREPSYANVEADQLVGEIK